MLISVAKANFFPSWFLWCSNFQLFLFIVDFYEWLFLPEWDKERIIWWVVLCWHRATFNATVESAERVRLKIAQTCGCLSAIIYSSKWRLELREDQNEVSCFIKLDLGCGGYLCEGDSVEKLKNEGGESLAGSSIPTVNSWSNSWHFSSQPFYEKAS